MSLRSNRPLNTCTPGALQSQRSAGLRSLALRASLLGLLALFSSLLSPTASRALPSALKLEALEHKNALPFRVPDTDSRAPALPSNPEREEGRGGSSGGGSSTPSTLALTSSPSSSIVTTSTFGVPPRASTPGAPFRFRAAPPSPLPVFSACAARLILSSLLLCVILPGLSAPHQSFSQRGLSAAERCEHIGHSHLSSSRGRFRGAPAPHPPTGGGETRSTASLLSPCCPPFPAAPSSESLRYITSAYHPHRTGQWQAGSSAGRAPPAPAG